MIINTIHKSRGWICAVGIALIFSMPSVSAQSLGKKPPIASGISPEQLERLKEAQEQSAEEQRIRDEEAAEAAERERTRLRRYEITCVIVALQARKNNVNISCGETRNRLYNVPGQRVHGTPLSGNALRISSEGGQSLSIYYDEDPDLASTATALALHARETGERVTILAFGNEPSHAYGPGRPLTLANIFLAPRQP